ncbi:Arylsulfatase [Anaerohalosphaera lusitana]|uniref:Arylsulfatase n=1 Tax=Anaerohalosphaera lusitana TaxID=1936003 RepID=A0A1U9NMD8_9BACT|nr:arylsulfatase [Anaerohalosphaera lusitana]AQT68967.1 Arylsulfatase [Anaerohalosphaera lusitana]
MDRRDFLKRAGMTAGAFALGTGSIGRAGVKISNDALTAKAGRNRPNIVFIISDQHRWDCIGAAGNSIIKTPNLDALAADGALFENGYVSVPSCTPARSSLLTGLSPWHHGMLGYGRVRNGYPAELPQMMRDSGYYTFGIGKMHWYPQKTLHGFHGTLVDESGRVESPDFISDYRRWFAEVAPNKNPDATGIGWNDYEAAQYALDEKLHPTTWTGRMATEFIETYDKNEPFFLKVSFARPHSPYDPPKRFWEMYEQDDMPAPYIGDWVDKYAEYNNYASSSWRAARSVDTVKRSRKGYYGNVSFIDEQVGKIIQTLKKKGLYDNSLIFFTADHGDMLGDHHMWRKTYAYEASTHVPMIMRWPKGYQASISRGASVPNPVELRDIMPTCLDMAGADIPPALDGMSMLKLVRGETADWREYIDLEHDVCYAAENHWISLTDGQFKYVYFLYDGSEQLFDMRQGRGELEDLAGKTEWASTLEMWRNRLIQHVSERGSQYVQNGQLQVWGSTRKLYSPYYNNLYDPWQA